MEAMLIREHPTKIIDGDTTYVVQICGEERIDGTWEGWLEFHATDINQPILRTEQETSQPNRAANRILGGWARTALSRGRARPCPGTVALVLMSSNQFVDRDLRSALRPS